MRFVISYKYSDVKIDRLESILNSVKTAISQSSNEFFCVYDVRDEVAPEDYSEHLMMRLAFTEIDKSDALFVVYDNAEKSAGMLMEIGYAYAKNKPVIMIINEKVDPGYVKSMAQAITYFNDVDDIEPAVIKVMKLFSESYFVGAKA